MLQLDAFTSAAVQAGPSALQGINLALPKIDDLVRNIDRQIDLLKPAAFEREGEIPGNAFGGGDRASNLAVSYRGAHRATYERLLQTKTDLLNFRTACVQAKQIIEDADHDAGSSLAARKSAVDALGYGATPFNEHHRKEHA
ncbi:hypothetical protein [Nocardioides panacisoli]|uniref:Uncharacterized protein n=1 Tax=Nocardioides panacisoli TaxID=627624 RepID=A0ABP7IF66_9ACTN